MLYYKITIDHITKTVREQLERIKSSCGTYGYAASGLQFITAPFQSLNRL